MGSLRLRAQAAVVNRVGKARSEVNSAEDCIRRAQDCEREAADTDDTQRRASLLDKAAEWRDLARRVLDLQRIDRLFVRQSDKVKLPPTQTDRL
jgi:hypothetical protein